MLLNSRLGRPRRGGPPHWHETEFGHDHDAEHGGGADAVYYNDDIELTTVGIDVGSSTSHLMFSRIYLRRLGEFLSSRYVVVGRETLYRSPILLTPYHADNTIDAAVLDDFIQTAYAESRLTPSDIDSGAIILTGEAIKRANARAVADLFAEHAGKFVCASAGHNLEAMLAANGSGALQRSRETTNAVLNVDVGGGTSKLALVHEGHVVETAAINVGGRLVAFDERGVVTRIEPAARLVADDLGIDVRLGVHLSATDQRRIAEVLADCLFEAIQRSALGDLAARLMLTAPLSGNYTVDAVTFSGGVSEYLYRRATPMYGDLAALLADAIRERIDRHALPAPLESSTEQIRATVIGASQFSVQVSGNTISVTRPDLLPLHNLQVLYPRLQNGHAVEAAELTAAIGASFQRFDLEEGAQPVAIAIKWVGEPRYAALRNLAVGVVDALPRTIAQRLPIVLVFAHDFGRLMGNIIRDELTAGADVISIDGIELREFDYIDIGAIIQPNNAVPVVVKSLVFPEVSSTRSEIADTISPLPA